MPTVTGTLETILDNETLPKGKVEIALCGYGSRVPRLNNAALAARVTDGDITIDTDGTFEFEVTGNDEIAPAGTYYTVTIRDDNGDIIQVNAYRFLSAPDTYDLNLIEPYDPNQPPPPLPPLLSNVLQMLGASDAMVFDGGSFYTAFKTTLPGNVTNPIFLNMKPGNLYTFIIAQDNTGGWSFVWAANVYNGAIVDLLPNSTTVQTFVADEFGNLYAIGPATYFP